MDIADIYDKFDQIGCLTFATIDEGYPQTRIAHLRGHDHEGIYFQTMITKAFYKQLKKMGKVSVCGMFPETSVSHDEQGMPLRFTVQPIWVSQKRLLRDTSVPSISNTIR